MSQNNLSEYNDYLSKNYNASSIANKLLLETNNAQDSTIELETSIKRLDFDIKDLNSKIDDNVKNNSKDLIDEFSKMESFKGEIESITPSINQLNISFDRLDNEIIKPYNECMNLHMALKKIHQTNKLLRSLTFAIYLINKIEEIDKSENNLSVRPFKHLYNLSILLNQLSSYLANPNLNSIKLIRDYIQFDQILIKRCQTIIQHQIKNLLNFSTQEYINVQNINNLNLNLDYEKSLFNLISSIMYLDEKNLLSTIELIYTSSTKHSINLILRNLNNTKYLPSYIKSLKLPSSLILQLDKCLSTIKWIGNQNESTNGTDENQITLWDYIISNHDSKIFNSDLKKLGILNKFWRDIALGVDPGIKEVVNRGGPIVRNLKNIKLELETAIKQTVDNSYNDSSEFSSEIGKTEKLETRMMLNSITNFEKRK